MWLSSALGVLQNGGTPLGKEKGEVGHVLLGFGELPIKIKTVEAILASDFDSGLDEGGPSRWVASHFREGVGVGSSSSNGEKSLCMWVFGVEGGDEVVHPLVVRDGESVSGDVRLDKGVEEVSEVGGGNGGWWVILSQP